MRQILCGLATYLVIFRRFYIGDMLDSISIHEPLQVARHLLQAVVIEQECELVQNIHN